MTQFPLTLSFKVAAINPQVRVLDGTGRLVAYGKQKAFKFKEDITIFEDEAQQRPLYRMQADRVIDFSARYAMYDAFGNPVGALQRIGGRSLWKATYNVFDRDGAIVGKIHEENPWVRAVDALFSDIPGLGLLSGYVFHPAYLFDLNGETALHMKKQPAFLEGSFKVDQRKFFMPKDEPLLLAGTIFSMMLERWRG